MLKSKKPRGRGFTLAEVMIVLTVIGILSAILLPVALHSTPDKNILKFKKANNTLATTIKSMISNDQYFTPGDFGRRPDGTLITGYDNLDDLNNVEEDDYYFGEALADNLSHKKFTKGTPSITYAPLTVSNAIAQTEHILKARIDDKCTIFPNEANARYMIFLPDETTIYMYEGYEPFGSHICNGGGVSCYRDPFDSTADFYGKSNGFDTAVYVICIDIDGSGPVKGFGYGIRRDGKIVNGLRADWWLSRDITKKETDCCPKSISNVTTSGGTTYNSCDTTDAICSE